MKMTRENRMVLRIHQQYQPGVYFNSGVPKHGEQQLTSKTDPVAVLGIGTSKCWIFCNEILMVSA
jgi:hypothetical protein